jgi:hypothetical protein
MKRMPFQRAVGMTPPVADRGRPQRRRRPVLAALVLGASLVLAATGGILAAARSVTVVGRVEGTAMVLQNVSNKDIVEDKRQICDGSFTHVMVNVSDASSALDALEAVKDCNLKVILCFIPIVNYSTGNVYPGLVANLVSSVKSHPALWGYLSVKEPSWSGITAAKITSLYNAFRVADPNHPVMALFGDIPHFGETANPYVAGMADVVMVDWYPVETANKGSSSSGYYYQANGPQWFTKVRNTVNARTPGRPIWLMVQTHKYLTPATHKKQMPTEALLRRQVREGLAGLDAKGIAFHTWSNPNYNMDQLRSPALIPWMKTISTQVRNGTFN